MAKKTSGTKYQFSCNMMKINTLQTAINFGFFAETLFFFVFFAFGPRLSITERVNGLFFRGKNMV